METETMKVAENETSAPSLELIERERLASLEGKDDEFYRERDRAARQRVKFVHDLEVQPVRDLVPITELSQAHVPAVDGEVTLLHPVGRWEPKCVSCGALLGYMTREGSYVAGKTECASCRAGSLEARLRASGISYREMLEPLDALVRPVDDPECQALDAKTLRERTAEFDRYLAFLRRFAALTPGERIDPPFAFVFGNVGTGKSAGAERALRDAIKNGCAGRVVRYSDMVRKIYDTYGKDGSGSESTADLVRLYSSIHLLVIHEVGPDAETDHALGLFFDFVDARFSAKLPTIFDANYAPEEDSLGARMGGRATDSVRVRGIIDRISGGVRENAFCLTGPSWRGRS